MNMGFDEIGNIQGRTGFEYHSSIPSVRRISQRVMNNFVEKSPRQRLIEELIVNSPYAVIRHGGLDGGPISGTIVAERSSWYFVRPFDLDAECYSDIALFRCCALNDQPVTNTPGDWGFALDNQRWYQFRELAFDFALEVRGHHPLDPLSRERRQWYLKLISGVDESKLAKIWFQSEQGATLFSTMLARR